jgi:two-component system nitrate/nitrite response regulator NarL
LPIRILLVDDNATVRRSLWRLLLSHGFEVCGEAENGRDAIEKAKQLKPQAIILDLSMPVMNGLEAAQLLHDCMPEVPILMYSSYSNATLEQQALAAGVTTVVDKAAPMGLLVKRLEELLGAPPQFNRPLGEVS